MPARGRFVHLLKQRRFWTHFGRNVSTWSPVGAAFNTKAQRRLNLLEKNGVCLLFLHHHQDSSDKNLLKVSVRCPGLIWGSRTELSRGVWGGRKESSEEDRTSVGEGLLWPFWGPNCGGFWPVIRWALQSSWSGELNAHNWVFTDLISQIQDLSLPFPSDKLHEVYVWIVIKVKLWLALE